MYVYIRNEDIYWVGFYDPNGKFILESPWKNLESAAGRVSYLNGSNRVVISQFKPKKDE